MTPVMRPLSEQERRELSETAAVFEMIIETNPADVSALEALVEIYAKLGDDDRLAQVKSRLRDVPGQPPPAKASRRGGARGGREPEPVAAVAQSVAAPAPEKIAPKRLLPLGDLLVAHGLITREQLADALRTQRSSKEKLGSILVRKNFITEDQLAGFLSHQYGVPSVTLTAAIIDPLVPRLIPADVARRYDLLPIKREGDTLTLAMADPVNVHAIDHVTFVTGLRVLPVVAAQGAIREAIEKAYEGQQGAVADALSALADDLAEVQVVEDSDALPTIDVFELKESADDPPVVKLVNMVLVDAIQRAASDIHFEPYEKIFRIRFRVDGVLHEMLAPPKGLEPAIVSRIKIMSNLDIAERRLPQDGRIKLRYNTREIDFRVSVLPTIFGEKAVLRILDKDALKLDLTQLGFDQWSLEQFSTAIHQPYGMVLITGPTGSGKTTTLYSAIHTINSPDHNIMTAEDPVEYNLKGVNQVQINEGVGRTFGTALRSFLRQDPDVILVGETRDLETAQISVRAALTGHLVFSTLHTNDCASTIARLVDMGVPAFLVASALVLVVAQRLGRRICRDCREAYDADEESLVPYGHELTGVGKTQFYKGKGCQACNFTGMKGRVAIYEIMPISQELRDVILKSGSTSEIRDMALSQGMKTLRQAALMKVMEGVTTIDEVLRVTVAE